MKNSKVYFSISQIKIMTAKHLLTEAGIPNFSIDKIDSAHAGVFGNIELHIESQHHERAKEILIEAEILAA